MAGSMLMPMSGNLPLFMMMGKNGGVGGTAAGAGIGAAGSGGAVGGATPGGGGMESIMPLLAKVFGGGGGGGEPAPQQQTDPGPHPPGYRGPAPMAPPVFEPLGGAYKTGGGAAADPAMQEMPILGSHGWHKQTGMDGLNRFFDNMSPEVRLMLGLGGAQQLMGALSRRGA